MLKNYFKIAIAVLKRRKFFTFISLFGIAFTLTILMVLTAFVDSVVSGGYPDYNRSNNLYVQLVKQQSKEKGFSMSGPGSFYFMNHYLGSIQVPAKFAIGSIFTATNAYVNNKRLVINQKFTNAAFWDVLRFDFIEGKPYSDQQIQNGEKVVVISEETRLNYFGDKGPVVGKFIEADNISYRVIGVVKDVSVVNIYAYADMFLPYTLSKSDYRSKSLGGTYMTIISPNNPADKDKVDAAFQQIVKKIPVENKEFDMLSSHADPYLTSFSRTLFGNDNSTGINMLITIAGIFILLFMLLPTLNLMNINISRILERSSEIGVRKAFGASSRTLVYQFIVENIILTFIGGAIGILLSIGIIQYINHIDLIPNLNLSFNLTVFISSILACLVFGLLSGVYPAWRMSKLPVVKALKAS